MNFSPLRYPGGKSKIASMVYKFIEKSPKRITSYYEPFCGGAGVALYLLLNDLVDFIAINDYDKAIYSFWRALFTETNNLTNKIIETPINIDEWKRQKGIYLNSTKYSLDLAFATLYLNRTNRSGIISAGPIGGYNQEGIWKMDARYNKEEIIKRIERISKYRNRVKVNNMDIRQYIKAHSFNDSCFIYFDPPYVNNAKRLYKNALTLNDHSEIAALISNISEGSWIITYDDTEFIRSLYSDYYISCFPIQYSAANKRKESELLICKDMHMIDNM